MFCLYLLAWTIESSPWIKGRDLIDGVSIRVREEETSPILAVCGHRVRFWPELVPQGQVHLFKRTFDGGSRALASEAGPGSTLSQLPDHNLYLCS